MPLDWSGMDKLVFILREYSILQGILLFIVNRFNVKYKITLLNYICKPHSVTLEKNVKLC